MRNALKEEGKVQSENEFGIKVSAVYNRFCEG
jgi:hypothetical protein